MFSQVRRSGGSARGALLVLRGEPIRKHAAREIGIFLKSARVVVGR